MALFFAHLTSNQKNQRGHCVRRTLHFERKTSRSTATLVDFFRQRLIYSRKTRLRMSTRDRKAWKTKSSWRIQTVVAHNYLCIRQFCMLMRMISKVSFVEGTSSIVLTVNLGHFRCTPMDLHWQADIQVPHRYRGSSFTDENDIIERWRTRSIDHFNCGSKGNSCKCSHW